MTDHRTVEFSKMHGTGNDFIVLDNREHQFSRSQLSELSARWCRRRYGVGADGLLALDAPETVDADYRMLYVNADGSWATMCGNGARCLARYACQNGFEHSEVAFETDAGLYRALVSEPDSGPVRLFVPEVTEFHSDVDLQRECPEGIQDLYYAHAGTQHLVAFVDAVDSVPVEDWGEHLRNDPSLAPPGANVNFVRIEGEGGLQVRTYEKGVEAETLSCGTGVLAVAKAAEESGRVEEGTTVAVHTWGGSLQVGQENTERGRERYLEGPAVRVYEGRVGIRADNAPLTETGP